MAAPSIQPNGTVTDAANYEPEVVNVIRNYLDTILRNDGDISGDIALELIKMIRQTMKRFQHRSDIPNCVTESVSTLWNKLLQLIEENYKDKKKQQQVEKFAKSLKELAPFNHSLGIHEKQCITNILSRNDFEEENEDLLELLNDYLALCANLITKKKLLGIRRERIIGAKMLSSTATNVKYSGGISVENWPNFSKELEEFINQFDPPVLVVKPKFTTSYDNLTNEAHTSNVFNQTIGLIIASLLTDEEELTFCDRELAGGNSDPDRIVMKGRDRLLFFELKKQSNLFGDLVSAITDSDSKLQHNCNQAFKQLALYFKNTGLTYCFLSTVETTWLIRKDGNKMYVSPPASWSSTEEGISLTSLLAYGIHLGRSFPSPLVGQLLTLTNGKRQESDSDNDDDGNDDRGEPERKKPRDEESKVFRRSHRQLMKKEKQNGSGSSSANTLNLKFVLNEFLGAGRIGRVLRVDHESNIIALKICDIVPYKSKKPYEDLSLVEHQSQIKNERDIYDLLQPLQGKYIPKFILEAHDSDSIAYGMQDCGNYVRPEKLTPIECRKIFNALKKIHSFNVIHGDVRFENILTPDYKQFYFVDFGLSKYSPNELEFKDEMCILQHLLPYPEFNCGFDQNETNLEKFFTGYAIKTLFTSPIYDILKGDDTDVNKFYHENLDYEVNCLKMIEDERLWCFDSQMKRHWSFVSQMMKITVQAVNRTNIETTVFGLRQFFRELKRHLRFFREPPKAMSSWIIFRWRDYTELAIDNAAIELDSATSDEGNFRVRPFFTNRCPSLIAIIIVSSNVDAREMAIKYNLICIDNQLDLIELKCRRKKNNDAPDIQEEMLFEHEPIVFNCLATGISFGRLPIVLMDICNIKWVKYLKPLNVCYLALTDWSNNDTDVLRHHNILSCDKLLCEDSSLAEVGLVGLLDNYFGNKNTIYAFNRGGEENSKRVELKDLIQFKSEELKVHKICWSAKMNGLNNLTAFPIWQVLPFHNFFETLCIPRY